MLGILKKANDARTVLNAAAHFDAEGDTKSRDDALARAEELYLELVAMCCATRENYRQWWHDREPTAAGGPTG